MSDLEPPPRRRLPARLHRLRPALIVAAVVLLAVMLALAWQSYTSNQDKAATGTRAKSLAEQVKLVCAQGGQAAKELGPACGQASKVAESPVVGGSTSIPVVTYRVVTPGPTTTVTFIRVTVSPGKVTPGPTQTIITPGPTTTETTTAPGSTSTSTSTVTVTRTETTSGQPTDTTTTTATVTTTAPGPTETTTEPGPTRTVTAPPTCVLGLAC